MKTSRPANPTRRYRTAVHGVTRVPDQLPRPDHYENQGDGDQSPTAARLHERIGEWRAAVPYAAFPRAANRNAGVFANGDRLDGRAPRARVARAGIQRL